MKSIYVDVLIILNIYVNFFLLKACARLTHSPLRTSRCAAAAAVGSLFSLVIFLPDMGFAISAAIKLTASFIIVAAAFGIKDIRHTLRLVVYFYIVNFIFGGALIVFYITFRPDFMTIGNTYFYIDFSLLSLVIFTAAAYFAVNIIRYFMDKNNANGKAYRVVIKKGGKSVSLNALADTGNYLVDMFSGKPVIICKKSELEGIIDMSAEPVPENARICYEKNSMRFIPYSTIGDCGMIAVFSPDEVLICDDEKGTRRSVDAMIGVNRKDSPAIFNPKLLC